MIVKGNQLIENRVKSATKGRGPPVYSSYQSIDRAFGASLATHLIMIDWSAENWRWYINFLEAKFQELTEGAISIDADVPINATEMEDAFTMRPHTNTQITSDSRRSRVTSPKTWRYAMQKVDTSSTLAELQPLPAQNTYTNPRSGKKQPLPPGIATISHGAADKKVIQKDKHGQRQFKFRHLQDIQDLEESVNETMLVLNLNLNICEQISRFYRTLFEGDELPSTLKTNCRGDMANFERKIHGAESSMNAQILKLAALLRLIADRKTLVN